MAQRITLRLVAAFCVIAGVATWMHLVETAASLKKYSWQVLKLAQDEGALDLERLARLHPEFNIHTVDEMHQDIAGRHSDRLLAMSWWVPGAFLAVGVTTAGLSMRKSPARASGFPQG